MRHTRKVGAIVIVLGVCLLTSCRHSVVAEQAPGTFTALHGAAQKGDKEAAELLLAKGANVNAVDGWGRTPLHWAVA